MRRGDAVGISTVDPRRAGLVASFDAPGEEEAYGHEKKDSATEGNGEKPAETEPMMAGVVVPAYVQMGHLVRVR